MSAREILPVSNLTCLQEWSQPRCLLRLLTPLLGGAANFNCDYTCNVYGFTAEGTSTVIGTWSLQNAKASLTQNEPVDVSFDLQLDPDANYSSFGLIFNNTRVANAGGMGCEISNILISGEAVPEPATASLGLLGLGALLLRRRRN